MQRDERIGLWSGVIAAFCAIGCDADGSRAPGLGDTVSSIRQGGEPIPLTAAKLNIEHNASAPDTGFQGFVDGEPWQLLRILDPDGHKVFEVRPHRDLAGLGITELFFETNEPEPDEMPLDEVLAVLPEGDYPFEARSVDGERMVGTALLTHVIPRGPVVVTPQPDEVVDPANLVVDWEPVSQSLTGATITIIAYQVIVELDEPETNPHAFAKLVFSVHVPDTVTSMTVPQEFLQPDSPYKLEVFAIEASGNQSFTEVTFSTAP